MNILTQLVHFLSTDNLELPGLLYKPQTPSKKIALYLHGCGSASIFYSKKTEIFAQELISKNIAFFPFNNRGAHYIKKLKKILPDGEEDRVTCGTSYELIKDCIHDIDGAVSYLKTLGYETFYLFGESTGANKIVVYNYYSKRDPFSKYALIAGGDDTGLYYSQLGKTKFFQALQKSKGEIIKGNGMKLVPKYISESPFSYQSLYDVLNPDGDYNIFPFYEYVHNLNLSKKELFCEFNKINKQTLVVYGSDDEYCYNDVPACINALKKHARNKNLFTFQTIPNCGHGFDGKEEELAKIIAEWLIGSSQ